MRSEELQRAELATYYPRSVQKMAVYSNAACAPTYYIRAHTNKAVYQQSQLCRAKVSWESRLVPVTELAS